MTILLVRSASKGVFAFGIIFFMLSGPVHAQAVRITLEPSATSPPIIDDRPSMTEWVANVHGADLVEGRLQLEVVANSQRLGSVLTDELVLTGVDQRLRILLPAYNWSIGIDEVVVQIQLLTRNGAIRLPPQRLRTSLPFIRKFPLMIGETKQRPRSTLGRDRLADHLRFEALLPDEMKEQAVTVMSQMSADSFPQDPLAFCHYEAVALADDVFAALRASQLEALEKWIRAGGSLYLEPEGVLEQGHLEFLNRLAVGDPRQLVFTLDEKGRLPAGTFAGEDGFLHLSPGLGRAVLGLPADDSLVPTSVWRNVAAALWKIRDEHRRPIVEQRQLPEQSRMSLQNRNGLGVALSVPPLADVAQHMVDWLRPQGVRMVPLWVIAVLLTALVVLIGPVDYLVLGWLKRRKWTWMTFPASVLVMTGLTVAITNAYLSSSEARRAFIIHDVADDGGIVRSNRFELVFTSATRRLQTEVQSALFTPLFTGGQIDVRSYRPPAAQQIVYVTGPNGQMIPTVQNAAGGFGGEITQTDPAAVQGRVPSRYTVIQDVRQWTPQLNRRFSIGPPANASVIDWNALPTPLVSDQSALAGTNFQELHEALRRQLGSQVQFAVLTSSAMIMNTDPNPQYRPAYSPDDPYQQQIRYQQQLDLSQSVQTGGVPFPQPVASPQLDALLRLTSAPPIGLSALTSHTSPHGGRSLDDLPLTVTGAADRWWLVIVVPQGDDLVVFRRSFRYGANSLRPMLSPEKLIPGR